MHQSKKEKIISGSNVKIEDVLLTEGKGYEDQIMFFLKTKFPGAFIIKRDEIPHGYKDKDETVPFDLSQKVELLPLAKFKFEKSIKNKIDDLKLETLLEKHFVNTT